MKIILITSFFPPTHTAGTEKRTFGYAKTLTERGYQVQVLCAGNWDDGEAYWNGFTDEIYEGIPVRRINLNWQKSPDPNTYLYANPLIKQYLQEWLPCWKPALVHITSCLTLSASIIPVIKDHNIPLVLTLTDFWFVCHKLSLLRYDGKLCDGNTTSSDCIQCLGNGSKIYHNLNTLLPEKLVIDALDKISKIPAISRHRGFRGFAINIEQRKIYLKKVINMADVITAPSNHLRKTVLGTGITNSIQVIQSGHDLSWISDDQKVPSSRIRFGYIGQITQTKGIHTLISAFQEKKIKQKADLHIFGNTTSDPTYFQELQNIIGPDQDAIFFHDPFPHNELGFILARIDMLIVPSLWHENNPRVIQEAFAAKTPVIASDVGGIAEFVKHGVNGFLFKRGDFNDLRTHIVKVVTEPALINTLKFQIPVVKSMDEEMDEFESIYSNLLHQPEVRVHE